jgi:hypothetical protein
LGRKQPTHVARSNSRTSGFQTNSIGTIHFRRITFSRSNTTGTKSRSSATASTASDRDIA